MRIQITYLSLNYLKQNFEAVFDLPRKQENNISEYLISETSLFEEFTDDSDQKAFVKEEKKAQALFSELLNALPIFGRSFLEDLGTFFF